MTTDLQRDLYSFCGMAKKLHEIVKRQDGSKRDDPNASLAAVKAAKATMGGSFQLHYYRPEGVLDWQVASSNKFKFWYLFILRV